MDVSNSTMFRDGRRKIGKYLLKKIIDKKTALKTLMIKAILIISNFFV